MRIGGIILCGGKSSRMGLSKATMPFGPEFMLHRVIRLLSKVAGPVAVVAAPDQRLPELPDEVIVCRDQHKGRGPLEGLYVGLLALEDLVECAYATSCDVPRLVPDFVRHLVGRLGEHHIAVPKDGRFHHPLAAVYRTTILPQVRALLDADRLRPFFLFEKVETLEISVEELKQVDPDLATLENLNRPEDYLAALARAGFEASPEIVKKLRASG